MISLTTLEKYVRAEDLICFADLILRWPCQAVIKIPYHITVGNTFESLTPYKLLEKSYTPEHVAFFHIEELNIDHSDAIIAMASSIVFLLSDVEKIESKNQEYRASRELLEKEPPCYLATHENIVEIMERILHILRIRDKSKSIISEMHKNNRLYSNVAHYLYTLFSDSHISPILETRPTDLDFYMSTQNLTTKDRASIFVKKCNPQDDVEKVLTFIEVEKRFPSLRREEIGELIPARSGTKIEKESRERRYSRLKQDAYQYCKIEIA